MKRPNAHSVSYAIGPGNHKVLLKIKKKKGHRKENVLQALLVLLDFN